MIDLKIYFHIHMSACSSLINNELIHIAKSNVYTPKSTILSMKFKKYYCFKWCSFMFLFANNFRTKEKIVQNINLSNFTPKESGPSPFGLRSIPSPTWTYRSSESAKWNRSPKGRFGQIPPRLSRCNNKATTTTKQEVSRRI